MVDIDNFLSNTNIKTQRVKLKLVVECNGIQYEKQIDGTADQLKPLINKLNLKLKNQSDSKKNVNSNISQPLPPQGGFKPSNSNAGNIPTPLVILPSNTGTINSKMLDNFNSSNNSNNNVVYNGSYVKPDTSKTQVNNNNSNSSNSGNNGSYVKPDTSKTHVNNSNSSGNLSNLVNTLPKETVIFGVLIETLMNRENNKSKVPVVVKNMVNYLFLHCLGVEGIFRISGSQIEIQSRKSSINKGDIEFPKEENPHVISVLLKQFLREMPEPLCTNELYDCFLASSDQLNNLETKESGFEMLKKTINQLPIINRVLFQYIFHFLTFIAQNSHLNLMTAVNLSRVFGPNLFWKVEKGNVDIHQLQATSEKINSVTEVMIKCYDQIFEEPLKIGKKLNLTAKLLGHKKSIQWLSLCDRDQKVWSLDSLGHVKIWDSQKKTKITEISIIPPETDDQNNSGGSVYQMISATNDCIWTATSISTSVWESSSGKLITEIPGEAYSLCESQFKEVWVGGAQVINIYAIDDVPCTALGGQDLLRSSIIRPISTDLFMKGVYILALCKVGTNRMWGCSSEKTLYIWDTKTKEIIHQTEVNEKRPKRMAAIEVDDVETVWIGGDEGGIQIFNAQTLKPIHKIANGGWDKIFYIASINKEIWASFWDTQIRIFDPKSREIIYNLKGYHSDSVSSIIEVPNSKGGDPFIWCGSFDKSISIHSLQSTKWILTNVKKNMARPIRQGFSSRGTNN